MYRIHLNQPGRRFFRSTVSSNRYMSFTKASTMTDIGGILEPRQLTVGASANQCLESFQKCVLLASSIHPRELSMVEDQVANFSTWARGIGVFAPGRASMDHRLRNALEVQGVVTGLLESLDYRIQTCRSCRSVTFHVIILLWRHPDS